jgi:hypothetical protein
MNDKQREALSGFFEHGVSTEEAINRVKAAARQAVPEFVGLAPSEVEKVIEACRNSAAIGRDAYIDIYEFTSRLNQALAAKVLDMKS